MRKLITAMAALVGVLVLLISVVSNASASTKQANGSPVPSCPAPLVFSGKKASCVPCPKGTQYEASKCKAVPVPACPAGYKFDVKTAKCLVPTASAPPVTTTTNIPGCIVRNGTTICNQHSTTTRTESDRKVETLSVDTGGVLQLRWAFTGGWQPAAKDKPFCHWVIGGVNSYYDKSGHLYKIDWTGKRAYICPSATSPTGWRKAGGPPNWENCGNIFWPPAVKMKKPVGIYYGKYKVVQNFSYNVKLSLTIHLHASVNANAQCKLGDNVNGSSANGSATGVDDESITVFATGSGTSVAEAIGKAHTVALTSKEVNDLYATVTATASLKMTATASATCSYTPPTPIPTPPCPTGWTGTYPNCAAPPTPNPVCPSGWSGTYPNCVPPSTPTPTPVCPSGWSGTYPNCAAPYAKILGVTDLNDIAAGQSSTNWFVSTNFSSAGTITVDPGNNKVMLCGGTTWTTGFLQVPVASGNGIQTCFVFLAPTDASTTTNTIKVSSAVPGAQPDSATDTYVISHPATNRPQSTG